MIKKIEINDCYLQSAPFQERFVWLKSIQITEEKNFKKEKIVNSENNCMKYFWQDYRSIAY